MSFHFVHFLFQAFVLNLTHDGVQLLQTLCLGVICNLDLRAFYLLLEFLMVLCLTYFVNAASYDHVDVHVHAI